jgi:DNA-directed RNA polymerase specialized sigma24 family protein
MTAGEREPEASGLPSPETGASPLVPPFDPEKLRAAWIEFYDAHYHRVIRFLTHNGAGLLDAQDAVQEAFTESWALMERNSDQWMAITGMPGWIRVVALRRYRRPPGARIRPLLAEGTDMPDVPDPSPGPGRLTVLTQTVLQTLRGLDEEMRAVAAFYLDDFSTDEIAHAIRTHDLRHTHATLLRLAREPVHVVSQRLGHASPVVTMTIYAHVLPGNQREAANTFARLIEEASEA